MTRLRRIVLAATVLALWGATGRPAAAFDFGLGLFKRKQIKADAPQSRAKQLVDVLRTDPDEEKRKAAATELKGLDPRNNPEIIPGLMASLQKDPSPAVRIEAVEVLGKLKPISEPAGLAMEAAFQTEPDPKVRNSIKQALFQYHLDGYKTPESGRPFATMTGPNAGPERSALKPPAFLPIKNSVGKALPPLLTPEPPLAAPKPKPPAPITTPAVAPELPKGAPQPMPTVRPPEPAPPRVEIPATTVTTPTVGGLPPLTIPQVEFPVAPTPPPAAKPVKF